MAEALKLLRQYVTEKKEFTEDDENIIFGDIAYPKEAKTNYMIYEYAFLIQKFSFNFTLKMN